MSRKRKRETMRWLSLTLSFLLILTMFSPFVSNASAKSVNISANEQAKISPKAKINKSLLQQFKNDEYVSFLVKFKEQVDTEKLAKELDQKASKANLSAAKKKQLKRHTLVSELRSTAKETQHEVLNYLEKAKKDGLAKETQSFFIVNAVAVTGTKEVMEKLASFPEVEKILPNETRQLYTGTKTKADTNDSKVQSIEWNVERVGAPAVWDMGIDGTGIVVASIDTGVQWDHPALKQKYRGYISENEVNHEYSWFDAVSGQSAPYDDHGHGTHVTGTMVGSEPDGSNQIGVAPGAKWIAVKAFTASGGTDWDLLEAGEWILAPTDRNGNPNPEMAPDVVNNSWGGGPGLDEWYRPMVQAWRAAEIFPEFSAGNTDLFNPGGPGSVANPANYPESVATGATDINDRLASFSLQGPSPYGEIKPELSAPGVNIRSSVPGSTYEGGWNGTSMAGPHVSAAVALLKQANSNLTVDQMEEILLSTAVPLTDATFPESPNNGYGHGLLNVFDAVSSVISGLGKVKGQVTKEGDDSEAPVLEHSAPSIVFEGMDLNLVASAVDNISVTNVQLEYQKNNGQWETVEATRVSGDYKDGVYEAVIPGSDIQVGTLVYRWKAVDFAGNETVSDPYEIEVRPGITVGYENDFESNVDGWTSFGQNDVWQWGVPTSGPNEAFSGEKVFATNLEGNYPNSANMSLMMPPIDVPEEGNTYLQFKQWYELERNWDYAHVFVSYDRENWTQLLRITDNSNGWIDGQVDLSSYAGERIYVAFNLTTDGSVQRQGWYIDDVKLSDTPIESPSKHIGLMKDLGVQTNSSIALKGEKVDPNKIKPFIPKKKKGNEETSNDYYPALLPLQAKVTVVETGRSVNTSPQDGSYEMTHASGTYTLLAEAYGYRSESVTVDIPQDGEVTANFTLEELPKGTISGKITNEVTGDPIEGATFYLMEDANVAPVTTNSEGEYSLTAYEGSYTLKVVAPYYYSKEISVNVEGEQEINVTLKPFIGYEGEIGYDDGTAENARAFYDPGNGWAVKMSLAEGNEKALVTGGLFRFWDTTWPSPGGTDFQVAVYDATGPDGAPGNKIAGPFDATAVRDGSWTHVDLSEHGIVVDKDFYLVYIQTSPYPNSPGLATDEDGPNAGRSWQLVGGAWSPTPDSEGNYMIRAIVNYEVTAPVITSPTDGSYTNESVVVVEGEAAPTTTVHLFNNGEEVQTTEVGNDGKFSVELNLNEGENVLTAKASTEQGMTEESAPVKVILDQTKPTLTITNPKDGEKTNRETVTVEGTVEDVNLDTVKVNGVKAKVENGKYSARIMLDEGMNEIKVVANDKAGNRTTKKISIDVKYTAPVIENLKPDTDQELKTGETVKIEFTSEPGLRASFVIHMPLTNLKVSNATELPMMELSPGYYVGYYTATKGMKAAGAQVEVKAVDSYGNESRQLAEGKLYINEKLKNNKKK